MKTVFLALADLRKHPYKLYQYQSTLHAVRLALAVSCAMLIAHFFRPAHGEWIGITVFVVLGTVQYQGAIAVKTMERITGTLLGVAIGMAVLWLNRRYLADGILYFMLTAIITFILGRRSLGRHGYTALYWEIREIIGLTTAGCVPSM